MEKDKGKLEKWEKIREEKKIPKKKRGGVRGVVGRATSKNTMFVRAWQQAGLLTWLFAQNWYRCYRGVLHVNIRPSTIQERVRRWETDMARKGRELEDNGHLLAPERRGINWLGRDREPVWLL
jgi:hypothetical protein